MMFLFHHGIKGMKWGVRRYQPYSNGSYSAPEKRALFVSGATKLADKSTPFYRDRLPQSVADALNSAMSEKVDILVGEAPGVDSMVQDFLKESGYKNVSVYTSYSSPRYNADYDSALGWTVKTVDSKGYEPGSKKFLAEKDKAMTRDSSHGLAVTVEGGSGATRRNIRRMARSGKEVTQIEIKKTGRETTTSNRR